MKIKFCGLKTVEEFVYAARLGVDFVGFVIYEQSIRYVSKKEIETILKNGRKILSDEGITEPKVVVLSVNQTVEELNSFSKQANFDIVQLYNEENIENLEINYWKVRNISSKNDILELFKLGVEMKKNEKCVGIILDSAHAIGGSGKQFDWSGLALNPLQTNYFIAGGINIDNIDELLEYKPYGIDLSSGIESTKGTKDFNLMKKIVEKVRTIDGRQ